eukprot:177393_1
MEPKIKPNSQTSHIKSFEIDAKLERLSQIKDIIKDDHALLVSKTQKTQSNRNWSTVLTQLQNEHEESLQKSYSKITGREFCFVVTAFSIGIGWLLFVTQQKNKDDYV